MTQSKETIKFFDFSRYHGKFPATGSTQIRVYQVIKYWQEAGLYLYGEEPDVLIFQKVYCSPDYKFPKHYPKIKILDLCDPDWLDGVTAIKESVDAVDAVTCSSEALTDFIKQLTDKPVVTIPDRFDISVVPERKSHSGATKKAVWFGYRHNAETLRPALPTLEELGLDLIVISDDDPLAWQWASRENMNDFKENKYTYMKYNEDTIYKDLQEADIAVLPIGGRPQDYFKSNNKTIKSILAGLPVAKNADDLHDLMTAEGREKYIAKNYQSIRDEYSILKSVEQYKDLINLLKNR